MAKERRQAGMHAPATFMRSHQHGCARTHTGIGVAGSQRRLSCPAAFGSNAFMNAMNQSIDRFGSLCCMLHATRPVVWVCPSFRCASMRSTRSGAGSECTHLLPTPLPHLVRTYSSAHRCGSQQRTVAAHRYPTLFGKPEYIKYIGWMLSDREAEVHAVGIQRSHTTRTTCTHSAIAQGGCRVTSVAYASARQTWDAVPVCNHAAWDTLPRRMPKCGPLPSRALTFQLSFLAGAACSNTPTS